MYRAYRDQFNSRPTTQSQTPPYHHGAVSTPAKSTPLSHGVPANQPVPPPSKQIDPKKLWEILSTQQDVKSLGSDGPVRNERGLHTVRIFLSSTFRDFYWEREEIAKRVVPALKQWCDQTVASSGRSLQVVYCDLRWGVPIDSTSLDTVLACLEEIDRCKADTEQRAFFVSLIGHRYGWIPTFESLNETVWNHYQFHENVSITAMEILHGAYRSRNPNAIFMIRDADFLDDVSPELRASDFEEKDPMRQQLQMDLRSAIEERFAGTDQVFHYRVKCTGVAPRDDNTGKQAVLSDLESFTDRVLEFLKAAIRRELEIQSSDEQCDDPVERLFPTELVCDETPHQHQQHRSDEPDGAAGGVGGGGRERTKWNDDHPAQLAYLEHLLATQPYGRAQLVDELADALRTGARRPNSELVVFSDNDSGNEDQTQSTATQTPTPGPERVSVVAVTGPSGYGKSTLVAWTMALVSGLVDPDVDKNCSEFRLLKRARRPDSIPSSSSSSKLVPFYHFMQCPFSTQEQGVPERVWAHLSTQIRRYLEAHAATQAAAASTNDGVDVGDGENGGEGECEGGGDGSGSSRAGAKELLALVRRLGRRPHASTRFLLVLDGLKYTDNVNNMELLPKPGDLPANVLVLASALHTHRPSRAFFRSYNAFEMRLKPLPAEAIERFAVSFYAQYAKRLDPKQIATLVAHPGARDPSWLSVAAAELLVYGDYFTLTARIASLPPTLAALLADILARLRRESPRLVWRPEPAAHEIRAGAHAANGGALRWIEPDAGDKSRSLETGLPLVDLLLSFLLVAGPSGLYEAQLGTLLASSIRPPASPRSRPHSSSVGGGDEKSCVFVPPRLVSQVMRDLRAFLQRMPYGNFVFTKPEVKQRVRDVLYPGDGGEQPAPKGSPKALFDVELELADYYEYTCRDEYIVARELPYHLMRLRQFDRLHRFFTSDPRAFRVGGYIQREYLKPLLCPNSPMALGGRQPETPQLCQFCANGRNKYSVRPGQMSSACCVCGDSAWNGPPAQVCHMHASLAPGLLRCFVCENVIPNAMGGRFPVKICGWCNFRRTCCRLIVSARDPAAHLLPHWQQNIYF